jgi:hypothetical protein
MFFDDRQYFLKNIVAFITGKKHFVKAHNHLPEVTQVCFQEHGSQGNTSIFQNQLLLPKGNSFKDLLKMVKQIQI